MGGTGFGAFRYASGRPPALTNMTLVMFVNKCSLRILSFQMWHEKWAVQDSNFPINSSMIFDRVNFAVSIPKEKWAVQDSNL